MARAYIRLQYAAVREVSQMDSGTLPVDLNGAPPLSVVGRFVATRLRRQLHHDPFPVHRCAGSRFATARHAGRPTLFIRLRRGRGVRVFVAVRSPRQVGDGQHLLPPRACLTIGLCATHQVGRETALYLAALHRSAVPRSRVCAAFRPLALALAFNTPCTSGRVASNERSASSG